ncbi:MAG: hypothetical protein P4L85_03130 [Paludisphaera borealis]|uniref:hypothetical protein n=1 Tax=Paludisphaera borealis TaxID=1387353 RepID=UPI002848D679|nr:hypothetical protein [Paludisphaera borealis]MDR3618317.1 hypothetical protein [Paludisphaera borealis]
MGYLFDGEVGFGGTDAKAPRRVLRLLAAALFAFAAVLGLPIAAVAVISLFAGNLPAFALMVLASPLVLMSVWLGRRLWSGEAAPQWFVALGLLIVVLEAVACLLLVVAVLYMIFVIPVIISL